MAEAGGPIYEGMGKPEATKKGLVDRVRERVKDRLALNTGVMVEQKWMDAYQKTVGAFDEGKRKKIAEKLRPVAVVIAKANRIGSAVTDVLIRVSGILNVLGGTHAIIRPHAVINYARTGLDRVADIPPSFIDEASRNTLAGTLRQAAARTPAQIRTRGAIQAGAGLIEGALGKARISRVASGWLADISGTAGEKIVQIQNKILRGKPRPEVAPA